MPSTGDDDHIHATKLFGSIDCNDVEQWLKKRGFTLNKDWSWNLPHRLHEMTEDEEFAVWFLIHEWDYNGLA